MRARLLDLLVCPACQGALALEDARREGGAVRSGTLRCRGCPAAYPVRDFIPRFVPDDAYVGSFSFEWHRFRDVQLDAANHFDESDRDFRWETGWTPGELEGRLVLDVGVGAGRFADVASRWGGEVVGVDLSFAVDAARQNLADRDRVHLVQADLFRLPFRPATFDRVYSLGVLHHTPDTRRAFRAIAPMVRAGGELAVFVYALGHYHYLSDLWRRVTTRLPKTLVYWLSALAIPLYYLHRVPVLGLAAQFVFPTANWPRPRWRWLDTFDWYTPRYQWKHTWPEVYGWFREAGFGDLTLHQEGPQTSLQQVCVRGRRP